MLTSGYLLWKEEFYKLVDGVVMGSPVSPIFVDMFMEDFEEKALFTTTTGPVTPRFYKRYEDDTFTILPSEKKAQRICGSKHLAAEQHVRQILHDNLWVPRLRHSD
ncbi:unnamed protein product [Parnassius mnemosyne]|uniref:Reverse transcriptase domain-containing protein n=1 Tax=Parnassius mnemosyne TaxID=213953 RepID=A0AAV1KV01_9NEOP